MIHKKIFQSAAVLTAVMLSVSLFTTGCGKQEEPVVSETVKDTEEPQETEENEEITPSPTATEIKEETVVENSDSEESLDNSEKG